MKFCHNQKTFFLLIFFSFQTTLPVTLVYSLRIRRLFNIPFVIERAKQKWPLSVVPIFFARRSTLTNNQTQQCVDEKRRTGGTIFNARYIHDKHWWAEATTAVLTDSGKFTGTECFNARRTGFDDVVLSGGYRHFFGDKIQLVGYGLWGIPTKRKITRCDRFGPLVGTRLFNLGVGLEFSYAFISELKHSFSFIFQGRFLHGFNRDWDPILPVGGKIQPGNVTDLFFIAQYRRKRTVVEAGYDITVFSNQALILPTQKTETSPFLRHSFYASVSHVFFNGLFGKPTILGVGVNGNYTKRVDAKVITAFLNCTVVF